MAWCIMKSCHKVVRSIRNTILKLCANCAKQFVRNAKNCGKTNLEFWYDKPPACTSMLVRFATIEEIKAKSKQELLAIPKSAFQKCFVDWLKRYHKCIIPEGGYFEGDKIVSLINKLIYLKTF